jgi:hypothetical protein
MGFLLERAKGLEPSTFCLASRRSTAELRPLFLLQETGFKLPEYSGSVNHKTRSRQVIRYRSWFIFDL